MAKHPPKDIMALCKCLDSTVTEATVMIPVTSMAEVESAFIANHYEKRTVNGKDQWWSDSVSWFSASLDTTKPNRVKLTFCIGE